MLKFTTPTVVQFVVLGIRSGAITVAENGRSKSAVCDKAHCREYEGDQPIQPLGYEYAH